MELDIQHEEGKRFYAVFGEEVAEVSYGEESDGVRDFRHTYVPHELRGRGIAEKIVRHALDDTKRRGYRFLASCPYVERFVQKHPEYQESLARSNA